MSLAKKFITEDPDKSVLKNRRDQLYNNGSIFNGNKFIVGFWGEYVVNALQYLADYALGDPLTGNEKKIHRYSMYAGLLTKWLGTYTTGLNIHQGEWKSGAKRSVIDSVDSLDLLWACEAVNFPATVKPRIESNMKMDTYKSIQYPIVMGHSGPGTVTLTIIEDRFMMFYQFFNALMNQFFDPLILKPTSSFQKMGMYIEVYNGFEFPDETIVDERGIPTGSGGDIDGLSDYHHRGTVMKLAPTQVFEFNSIVLSNVSDQAYNSGDFNKKSFTVTFECPNLFQNGFNTKSTFRGLANNTGDKNINKDSSVDGNTMLDETHYNTCAFEESSSSDDGNYVVKKGNYTNFGMF